MGINEITEKAWDSIKIQDEPSALDRQIGGSHYKDYAIQPIEFITKNRLSYCEANAIKYLCRWREKNGVEDLRKAIHYIELLIDIEIES